MADTIAVSCPKCKKTIKAPAALKGKKVRCKGCGEVFPIVEAEPADQNRDEEWGDVIKSYGVNVEKDAPRCPFCAQELERADDVVCLHCGYNLETRERLQQQVLEPVEGMDWFMHLLPGILSALVIPIWGFIVILIGLWGTGCAKGFFPDNTGPQLGGFVCPFCCGYLLLWFPAKFAFQRLILHPRPPEKQKRLKKEPQ